MKFITQTNARHVIRQYFFDGPEKLTSYLNMLQQWFTPKLIERGIKEEIYFQQDGAPAHHALSVREYLKDTFPDKRIGRGSVTSPAPIEWPARSPVLTTCDNSLWGHIKDIVSKQRYHSNDELKAVVTAAFGSVTPAIRAGLRGAATGAIAPGPPLQGAPGDEIYLFQIKQPFEKCL